MTNFYTDLCAELIFDFDLQDIVTTTDSVAFNVQPLINVSLHFEATKQ